MSNTVGAPAAQPLPGGARTSRRPFETSLLLAGVRCTVRYVVLPFALPLLGVTAAAATGATLAASLTLDVLAALSIVTTLRRLWRIRHPRRWRYAPLATALVVLVGLFLVNDVQRLTPWA